MHTATVPSPSRPKNFSAQQTIDPVTFTCDAPDAKSVYLSGDFNDWDPDAYSMKRMPDGTWQSKIQLNPGEHHYWFLVDGKATLDPKAHGRAHDIENHRVSRVTVDYI